MGPSVFPQLASLAIISADWVEDSLQRYSERIDISGWIPGITSRIGYYRDLGYGYQWWSAKAGDHNFDFAWGHGGQLVVLLDEFDMVIVLTSYPYYLEHNDQSWKHEKANINLVSKFIGSLPGV